MCFLHGTTEISCVDYDGSDKWKKIHVEASAPSSGSMGCKFKTASVTDDVFIDSVSLSNTSTVQTGVPAGDWVAYTPPNPQNGFGNLANVDLQWRRSGTMMHIRGEFDTGTVSGVEARLALPAGYTVSTDNPSNSIVVGTMGKAYASGSLNFVLAYSGLSYVRFSEWVDGVATNNLAPIGS